MAIYNVKIIDSDGNESMQPIGALANNVILQNEQVDVATKIGTLEENISDLETTIEDLGNNTSSAHQFSVTGSNLVTDWYRIAKQELGLGGCYICIVDDAYDSADEIWKTVTYNLVYQAGGKDISKGSFRILGNGITDPTYGLYTGVKNIRVVQEDGYNYLDIFYERPESDALYGDYFNEQKCCITVTNLCNYTDSYNDSAIWNPYVDEENNTFVSLEWFEEGVINTPHVFQRLYNGAVAPYENQFTVRADNLITPGWYRFAQSPGVAVGLVGIGISEVGAGADTTEPGGASYNLIGLGNYICDGITLFHNRGFAVGSGGPSRFNRIRQNGNYLEVYFDNEYRAEEKGLGSSVAITVSNFNTFPEYSYKEKATYPLNPDEIAGLKNTSLKWEPCQLTYVDNEETSEEDKYYVFNIDTNLGFFDHITSDELYDELGLQSEQIIDAVKTGLTYSNGNLYRDRSWYKIASRFGPENAFTSVGSYQCDFYINHPSNAYPGEYKHFREIVTGASGTEGKEQATIRKMITSYGGATFSRNEFADASTIPNGIYALRIVRSTSPAFGNMYEYFLEIYWAGQTSIDNDQIYVTVDFKGNPYSAWESAIENYDYYDFDDFCWHAITPIVNNRSDSKLVINYILEAPFDEVAPATTADLVELKDEILAEAGGGDAASISYDGSKVEPAIEQDNVQDALDVIKQMVIEIYTGMLKHGEKIAALETEVANLRTEFLGEVDTVAEIVGGEEGTT